jgi:thioredoxin-dependent peroxiredoxin
MLEVGQVAPPFSLPDADMESVDLAQFKGKKNVVLYFYQRDGSPGCTTQAIDFTDAEDEFARHNTIIIGISPDDCIKHQEFRDENGISICLLADVDGEAGRRYGVWHEREVNGVIKPSIQRSTFIIDKQGQLRTTLYGVSPRGHAREVLAAVKALKLS